MKEGHVSRLAVQYVIKTSPNRAGVLVYMRESGARLALDQRELLRHKPSVFQRDFFRIRIISVDLLRTMCT